MSESTSDTGWRVGVVASRQFLAAGPKEAAAGVGYRPAPIPDRVLATIVITRLVSPAQTATRLGDRKWNELLKRLRDSARDIIGRFGGHPGTASVEEFSAHFDGPARAVRCALALRDAAYGLGIKLAAGVHAGEIEMRAIASPDSHCMLPNRSQHARQPETF